ncbi:hypothetical protein ONR57_12205 [Hoyosella sp. YIM 151337]|uniref:hypothetical protein n=1 Tax=Hoyosella sp. YIM 151337 TaxID=2992742 RepID=UPI0022368B63|nr:hypothetical protein [Hoyosella sp. YIM 151337]MCW4354063.1 hypothetical protein [Hoyosella sp. YIM 151337]
MRVLSRKVAAGLVGAVALAGGAGAVAMANTPSGPGEGAHLACTSAKTEGVNERVLYRNGERVNLGPGGLVGLLSAEGWSAETSDDTTVLSGPDGEHRVLVHNRGGSCGEAAHAGL